ncbi:DUF397 domain-containing protein [Streptomyces acidiscabies]|uniref:DUF397 domain-containing protein n=1 Tax=Streptomyces acidiscabies TaxID=42234 RepID=A0AAP6BGV5_9ACTN|nr:DUF397 domain-containing protein [Streptomyces acidiscabies]MDX2964222.1 DUF397 domain-containing protein [Streptomyces acidiscabies]MDX3016807.1 DUF397 domain-containing protein [Streptomyces acidiscabies]MDX3794110.1 DUF397 domain-containing protein [Streptomyces acidiscabies]GAQ54736.1 hypothetical protein a10_04551 [Streptomyces acidiscabies]GAV38173.1 hypothetical protein Saa2_01052 [Streptomyces acidiscabies]
MTDQTWRKSSYSGVESNSCLEVLDDHPSGVPVRDSKLAEGPALLVGPSAWTSFIASVKERTSHA